MTKEMQHLGNRMGYRRHLIRRTFELEENLSKAPAYLKYSHDDIFELYINGIQVAKTGYTWKNGCLAGIERSRQKRP